MQSDQEVTEIQEEAYQPETRYLSLFRNQYRSSRKIKLNVFHLLNVNVLELIALV